MKGVKVRNNKALVFILSVVLALILLITSRVVMRSSQKPLVINATSITTYDTPIPSRTIPWGIAVDRIGNLWLALPNCDPNPKCTSTIAPGKIAEYNPDTAHWIATYSLPMGFGQPLFLAFDSQGMLWFPMFQTNSIGMFNPTTKTFRQWLVPTPNSGPWDVAVDHHNLIWFTEHYTNKIGQFDPLTQTFKEVVTPSTISNPYGIIVDAANNIWFTENNPLVPLIGEYTVQGQLLEYKLPHTTSQVTPHLLVIDLNNNIWWSEGLAGRIGRLVLRSAKPGTSNGVTEYTYPKPCKTCNTHTSGISIDHAGNIWFDDSEQGIFGSISESGQGAFRIYNTLTHYSHPHDGFIVDASDRIWFTEETDRQLGLAIRSNTIS